MFFVKMANEKITADSSRSFLKKKQKKLITINCQLHKNRIAKIEQFFLSSFSCQANTVVRQVCHADSSRC